MASLGQYNPTNMPCHSEARDMAAWSCSIFQQAAWSSSHEPAVAKSTPSWAININNFDFQQHNNTRAQVW